MQSYDSRYIYYPQQFSSSSYPIVVATYSEPGGNTLRLYIDNYNFRVVNLSSGNGVSTEFSTTVNYIAIGLK